MQCFEKNAISEPLRGQRSAAFIFKKLNAIYIYIYIYIYITYYILLQSIFFTDFKKGYGALVILYKAVIYQEMTSLIWSGEGQSVQNCQKLSICQK